MVNGTSLVVWLITLLLVALAVGGQPRGSGSVSQPGPLPDDDLALDLLQRWRERAARWRSAAVVPAMLAAAVAGLLLRQSVGVGVGGPHPPWADPVLAGMLAALLGAIGAELHHLRPSGGGVRIADLAPRDAAPLRPEGARTRQVLLTSAAAAVTAIAAAPPGAGVPWLGLAALVAAAGIPFAQRGIALRARPALPESLRTADHTVRQLAIHSIDHAGAGLVLLLTAWQAPAIYTHLDLAEPSALPLTIAQIAAFVISFRWWRHSHPDRLTNQRAPQSTADTPA